MERSVDRRLWASAPKCPVWSIKERHQGVPPNTCNRQEIRSSRPSSRWTKRCMDAERRTAVGRYELRTRRRRPTTWNRVVLWRRPAGPTDQPASQPASRAWLPGCLPACLVCPVDQQNMCTTHGRTDGRSSASPTRLINNNESNNCMWVSPYNLSNAAVYLDTAIVLLPRDDPYLTIIILSITNVFKWDVS